MKIIALKSKHNSYCVNTIICEDNEVSEIVAEKEANWDIVINNWFG